MPFSGPKWPICHEQFFWYKPLSLLSSTYWPFSLWKILKNSSSRSRVMKMHHFGAQNGSFAPNNCFFWKIINIILIYLLAPIIGQNFKKFCKRIQSYEDVPFLGPKWSICPKQINIILIYLLAPFIGQNFKKILPADPELWECAIFGPKMTHSPKWEFFSENC